MSELTKASRIIMVLEVVKSLGRASPDRIIQVLSAQSQMSSEDKNERRKLYRDLKELADAGQLCVEYFTADGAKVGVDDSDDEKFLRAEYFLPGSNLTIPGDGLLKAAGITFSRSNNDSIHWSCSEYQGNVDLPPRKNKTTLFIELPDESYLCLQLANDERPATLLIAGESFEKNRSVQAAPGMIQDLSRRRFGILYFKNRTVSKRLQSGRQGHALINFLPDPNLIQISDLGSTNGTKVAAAPKDFLQALRYGDSAQTAPVGSLKRVSSFRQQFEPAEADKTYRGPLFLKFGSVNMFIISD